ncbi:serine/threonine dehydratase [[Actinomadura] parvosata]|uniref:serine/threonine dehydratase n=1 Tax=[Actinomadura] parvosata TaxID=1955412 RepID=UPI001E2AA002|nr:serine/threonine dehydratase [Nonomuraea sp. ATCC 55076]
MTTVTHEHVLAAARRIAGHVLRTPVIQISPGLWLKLELLQHAGSFKVRGAFNRILSAGELPDSGVIAASGGNHGLAVAFAARALGVRAEIYVPEVTSPVKVDGLRALGAHIVQTGAIYSEAADAAAKRAAETGALSVHAYDQAEVVAGQGTTGLELVEQVGAAPDGAPDPAQGAALDTAQGAALDTVLVAVGGGGFAAGITLGTAGSTPGSGPKIVAVEPERIPTLNAALQAGEPVQVEVGGVGADALGASKIGGLAFEVLSGPRVESVLVTDEAIVSARRTLWERHRLAAEHAGAAAYAALLSGAYQPEPGERVAVVVCGSNTDPATLTTS